MQTFAEKGFAASRTRDIAARAGVAEGTIYLYFESKDELLLTAFRAAVREFSRCVEELLHDDRSFADRLETFVSSQFVRIEADPGLAAVLLFEARQSTKFYDGAVRDVLRDYASAVDRLLASGMKSGEVRSDLDIQLARRLLIGALEEVELNWLLSDRNRPLVPQAAAVAKMVIGGVGG